MSKSCLLLTMYLRLVIPQAFLFNLLLLTSSELGRANNNSVRCVRRKCALAKDLVYLLYEQRNFNTWTMWSLLLKDKAYICKLRGFQTGSKEWNLPEKQISANWNVSIHIYISFLLLGIFMNVCCCCLW